MSLTEVRTEIQRNGWGQPMVIPPGGGKRCGYKRTTTFVDVTEAQRGLMNWMKGRTAFGMGQRPDLVLAAAASRIDDKAGLLSIAEKAMEHAEGSAAATTGTALHALTQRVDEGGLLGQVPDSAVADIEAYERATSGLIHLAVEQFRVHDDWKVAGTPDRVSMLDGEIFIADVKTGSIDYPSKMAMQLAMYAHSLPYDVSTDERGPQTDGLNLQRAIIIHLPAGTATCRLVWIDIERGWEACQLAKQIWEWRAQRNLTWAVDDEPAPLAWALSAAMAAPDVDALRELWKTSAANGTLDRRLKTAIEARRRELVA